MIFDLLQSTPDLEDAADVCVIGAGAAGICLALELARQGKRVVLLEGGGRTLEDAAQEPYRSEVTGLPHRGVHTGRFRVHGGTTTKWGGQILELDAEDFRPRSWVPGSGWPFGKEELVPHYRRALELEGVVGAMEEDADVWGALGMPVPKFGDLCPYFSRWCPEPNFALLHREALENSVAIRVWLHANAVELLLEQDVARGVRCRTQDGREVVFRAEQFCFCLGTIECVRFFLQPREGALPWNASGLLGKHFQDHLDVNTAEVTPRNRSRFADLFDNVVFRGFKYHPKLRLSFSEQERRGVLNCAATMAFESDITETVAALKGTAKLLLRGRWRDVSAGEVVRMVRHTPLMVRQGMRFATRHRVWNPADATLRLRVHCEQEPMSASSLGLSAERDSLGLLRTRLDWRVAELELKTVREYTRTAVQALAEVAQLTPAAGLMEGDPAFVRQCDDSNHHMGGMRMHASSKAGVVTPDLQLHGTQNVYVCSGAVFPSSGFSNPTHTVLALAMRLAEHLRYG